MSNAVATLHEANARNDERCLDLRAKHGAAGYGAYWMLVEMMRETATYKLRKANIPAIAFGLVMPEADARGVIATCLENGLFSEDGESFWSPSLLRRMTKFEATQGKRSAAGKASAAARVQRKRSKRSTLVEQTLNTDRIELEENKNKKEKEILVQFGDHVRMTDAEHGKLVETFGAAIVAQEIPELDVWIAEAETPNAVKYRRPEHNHYLLARSTWLPDKKLRDDPKAKGRGKDFQERRAERQDEAVSKAKAMRAAQDALFEKPKPQPRIGGRE